MSAPLDCSTPPPADDLDHGNHHRGIQSAPDVPAVQVTVVAAAAASVAEVCSDLQQAASLTDGDTWKIDYPLPVETWADVRNP